MMEFTLSRVVMGLCGLLALSAVMGPYSGLLEHQTDQAGLEAADSIASFLDSLSGMGEGTSYRMPCRDLLPSPSWWMVLEGESISLRTEGRVYVSHSQASMPEGRLTLGYEDVLEARVLGDGRVHLEKVLDMDRSASMSRSMSSSSLYT